MSLYDLLGYAAAVLVFAAFYMKGMIGLRIIGLCSNLAFLVYALGHNLPPVALLHAMLIPVNCWRLYQLLREGQETAQPASVRHTPLSASRSCSQPTANANAGRAGARAWARHQA